jgi:hypothetical protein
MIAMKAIPKLAIKKMTLIALLSMSLLVGFAQTANLVHADQLPQSELDAIDDWPTWVASACSTVASTTLTGNGNGVEAYNFFISHGLTPIAASGIVGNMTEESTGVDPERLEGYYTGEQPAESSEVQADLNVNDDGWGIVQWSPPSSIITAGESQGASAGTIDTLSFQLGFLYSELKTSYSSVIPQLNAAATPEDAATIFLNGFEGGDPSPTRQAYARAYYELAVNNTPLPPSVPVSYNSGGGGSSGSSSSGSSSSSSSSGCGSGSSSSSSPSSSSAYQDPLRSVVGLTPNRIDEGVDYTGTGTVYAMGNGKVLSTAGGGWPGNVFLVYQLDSGSSGGPAAGDYVYVAEDCTPIVGPGDTVNSNTPICTMYNGGSGIETGWAQAPSNGDIAMAHDVYVGHDGLSTAFGQNYSQLLQSLGAPPGNQDLSTVYPGVSGGTLPPGWPTW